MAAMFSKRHYELVAKTIKELDVPWFERSHIAHQFAVQFMRDNNNFNYERFTTACGVGGTNG